VVEFYFRTISTTQRFKEMKVSFIRYTFFTGNNSIRPIKLFIEISYRRCGTWNTSHAINWVHGSEQLHLHWQLALLKHI
jgi:hypothetical protein